jgi:transposase-like protein
MKRREKRREEIVSEYLAGDSSYREMEARYGVSSSTLQRWVKAAGLTVGQREGGFREEDPGVNRDAAPDLAAEVKRLRGELHRSELHNKLLNAMIDIAEEELEVPIRKKRGAKQ